MKERKVRHTLEHWQTFNIKIQTLLHKAKCLVRQLMSLMGLQTATVKQVHLSWVDMRLIQWHLKSNWGVPDSLEQVKPFPGPLHSHGQPLQTLKHVLQISTDASK